jgi:allophanate hydrolase subunit 1
MKTKNKMNNNVDIEEDIDITQTSIAITNLCSVLNIIQNNRNDEVKFHKYIFRAKELQRRLYEMESELKKQLRNINN